MSNFKNPFIKDNEKQQNFVSHLNLKKVKQFSRSRFRQQLRVSIQLNLLKSITESDPTIH